MIELFEHMVDHHRVYLVGMWIICMGSTLVSCYFASRLAKQLRKQQMQLAAAREENLKNEYLTDIGTAAVSIVHSLATPLSTLTVLVEDLARIHSIEPALRDDLALMLTQINHCKQTMKNLVTLTRCTSNNKVITLEELQSELEEYYCLNSPGNIPHFTTDEKSAACRVSGNPLLQHALVNLINNAIESEGAPAGVSFRRQEQQLNIIIRNDTALRTSDIFQRWGKLQISEKQASLGIGSFLANNTIEKLGGTVRLRAEAGNTSGRTQIEVTVSVPLEN